ncbi:hypothetical protein [Rhodococcoides fascians]|uniref:hypothetical protein n=1 Tax=Rhodococcoides fascians TaxID=1828 RepID=UPI000A9E663E|nr:MULTISPECIES: hypothetical protein [Rhodococcus]
MFIVAVQVDPGVTLDGAAIETGAAILSRLSAATAGAAALIAGFRGSVIVVGNEVVGAGTVVVGRLTVGTDEVVSAGGAGVETAGPTSSLVGGVDAVIEDSVDSSVLLTCVDGVSLLAVAPGTRVAHVGGGAAEVVGGTVIVGVGTTVASTAQTCSVTDESGIG